MDLEQYQFKYPWRKYQANVLAELDGHMHDDRLNIVAAPGSGKTILGLEIVRRINKNVLILAPTITIKKQWVDRFLTLFVQDQPMPDFISTDIYELKNFNVATYQGLHFAHRRKKITCEPSGEEEEDSTPIRGESINYDLIAQLKKQKIEVIVFDEAHHLRNAWWKSLTEVLKSLDEVRLICLTATPPYDVEKSEWDKYVDLCGPIDCEISVPELVATNDLSPHQDFVIFNKLAGKEEKQVLDIQGKFDDFAKALKTNQDFINAIGTMPELTDYTAHEEKIFENPKYYSSLLIFLHAVGVKVDKKIVRALGGRSQLPSLNTDWFEIMLQGVLIDDHDLFANQQTLIESLRDDLSRRGGIENKRITIQNNQELKKLMASSVGKMVSMVEITRREYTCLQNELSMVILTDYIRAEALSNESHNKIGVVPIFKAMIRANICPNVAILTGSLKVIPKSLIPFVEEKLPDCGFHELMNGYVSIKIKDQYKNQLVGIITEAVNEKKINVIIGTVALLGQGWDCPAINSLILASFVGSFVLSNQMRGRAIRQSKNDPKKSANIWHLVSITRHDYESHRFSSASDLSDYRTLKRRFRGFVGIAYHNNVIQNGLERLDIISECELPKEFEQVNENMYQLAKNRDKTRKRWYETLALFGGEDIKIASTLKRRARLENFKIFAIHDLQQLILGLVGMIVFSILRLARGVALHIAMEIVIFLIFGLWEFYFLKKLIGHYNPVKNMEQVGDALLRALQKVGAIQTPQGFVMSSVEKTETDWGKDFRDRKANLYSTNLHGATVYENNLYIKCIQEVYGRVNNARYVIKVSSLFGFRTSYFNVPTLFATNKNNAEVFYAEWKKSIGKGTLVYTRNTNGRKLLLDARKGSFDYDDKFFELKRALKHENWK